MEEKRKAVLAVSASPRFVAGIHLRRREPGFPPARE